MIRDRWAADYEGQIIVSATATRALVFVSVVMLYLLVYDAIDIMNDDNLATLLSTQIQVRIALISMVRKPSVEPIVLAELLPFSKAQKIIQVTYQRGI